MGADECSGGCERPLVACPECGRHLRRAEDACPFCGRVGLGASLRKAAVAVAFFGAAAVPGCAYGPPPDDFDTADGDVAAEVSPDGIGADADDALGADASPDAAD